MVQKFQFRLIGALGGPILCLSLPVGCERAVETVVEETIEVREVNFSNDSPADSGDLIEISLLPDSSVRWNIDELRGSGDLSAFETLLDTELASSGVPDDTGVRVSVAAGVQTEGVVELLEMLSARGIDSITFSDGEE